MPEEAAGIPLVAWTVDQAADADDPGMEVVFAATEEAARTSHAKACGLDAEGVQATRSPVFDRWVPGPVPVAALLEAGWWIPCGHCEHHVTGDGCERCADEDDRQEVADPVVRGDLVFCDRECETAWGEERQQRRAGIARAMREARAEFRRRFPDATITTVVPSYEAWEKGAWTGIVGYTFPGSTCGECRWREDVPGSSMVPAGDQEAWRIWAQGQAERARQVASGRPPPPATGGAFGRARIETAATAEGAAWICLLYRRPEDEADRRDLLRHAAAALTALSLLCTTAPEPVAAVTRTPWHGPSRPLVQATGARVPVDLVEARRRVQDLVDRLGEWGEEDPVVQVDLVVYPFPCSELVAEAGPRVHC